jgi:hypothetical protein
MINLLGLVLMDKTAIFITCFEYMIFSLLYLLHSLIHASDSLLNDFVKKVKLNQLNLLDSGNSGIILIFDATKNK